MEIFAKTEIGNVRVVNQDCVQYLKKNENECLTVLCDGMGGHNAGEVASSLACEAILAVYRNHNLFINADEIHTWMIDAINHAHHKIYEKSQTDPQFEGMGTTVVLALIKDDVLYVSHVGDSRAYFYDYKELYQLTKDDTLVNALVDSGTITQEEAMYHPQKNILLQAVGVSDVLKISFTSKKLNNEIILLCSDGLYNSLTDKQIKEFLHMQKSIEEIGIKLMTAANIFGGRDNIGFILIKNKGVVKDESNE